MENEFVPRSGRVYIFRYAFEPNRASLQLGNGFDEVLERASQTIQPPDDERIPGTEKLERLRQSRSFGEASARDVGENLFAVIFLQGIFL